MKPFRWNAGKNENLRVTRGVTFENVAVAIESGGLLGVLTHPNQRKYPGQRIWVVTWDGYAYLVPFAEEDGYLFLKTIIPSRKATRDFLEAGDDDVEA